MLLNGMLCGSHRTRKIPLQTLLPVTVLISVNVPDQGLVLMIRKKMIRDIPPPISRIASVVIRAHSDGLEPENVTLNRHAAITHDLKAGRRNATASHASGGSHSSSDLKTNKTSAKATNFNVPCNVPIAWIGGAFLMQP